VFGVWRVLNSKLTRTIGRENANQETSQKFRLPLPFRNINYLPLLHSALRRLQIAAAHS
jgi:hypothetical protein